VSALCQLQEPVAEASGKSQSQRKKKEGGLCDRSRHATLVRFIQLKKLRRISYAPARAALTRTSGFGACAIRPKYNLYERWMPYMTGKTASASPHPR
jgi:hypothetical protein